MYTNFSVAVLRPGGGLSFILSGAWQGVLRKLRYGSLLNVKSGTLDTFYIRLYSRIPV